MSYLVLAGKLISCTIFTGIDFEVSVNSTKSEIQANFFKVKVNSERANTFFSLEKK